MNFLDPRLPERFWNKVNMDPSGCWLWTGALSDKRRAHFGIRSEDGKFKIAYAHRVAFEAANGSIDRSLTIDHLCGIPSCVNPAHLEQVTGDENRKRFANGISHCKAGHEYAPGSHYVAKNGGGRFKRLCKVCHAGRVAAYQARVRARAA